MQTTACAPFILQDDILPEILRDGSFCRSELKMEYLERQRRGICELETTLSFGLSSPVWSVAIITGNR